MYFRNESRDLRKALDYTEKQLAEKLAHIENLEKTIDQLRGDNGQNCKFTNKNGFKVLSDNTRATSPSPSKSNEVSTTPVDVNNQSSVEKPVETSVPVVDFLIVGNSQTRDIDKNRVYKHKVVEVKTLDNGKKHLDGALEYVKTCNLNPKVILLQAASNSLDSGSSIDSCLEKCQEIVQTCKSRFPNSHVCLSESLPRKTGDNSKRGYNQKCMEFNARLDSVSGATIVRHPNLNNTNTPSYQNDRIHLSEKGIARLIGNYKQSVNPLLGMKTYTASSDNDSQGYKPKHVLSHGHGNFHRKPMPNQYHNQQRSRHSSSQNPKWRQNEKITSNSNNHDHVKLNKISALFANLFSRL